MLCTTLVFYVGQEYFARAFGFLLIGALIGSALSGPFGGKPKLFTHMFSVSYKLSKMSSYDFSYTCSHIGLPCYIIWIVKWRSIVGNAFFGSNTFSAVLVFIFVSWFKGVAVMNKHNAHVPHDVSYVHYHILSLVKLNEMFNQREGRK